LTFGASEEYIVNGISMLANKVIVVRASGAGSVIAYNYMDDAYICGNCGGGSSGDTWVEVGLNCSHLVGSHACLFEGNQSFNTDNDFTHGNSGHLTYFRNWLTGFRAAFTSLDGTAVNDGTNTPTGVGPLRAISDHPYSYWDSFIGNVAGTSGRVLSWNLRCASGNADSSCTPGTIYNLGWNDTSVLGSLPDGTMGVSYPSAPNGTITGPGCLSTSNCAPVLDGNYDYKSNSIQWASNDTAHTLPSSLYLSVKPAFFSAGSCTYPWPWVTPTDTPPIQVNSCGGSALPAKARWDASTPFSQP
jgi:hypothetical protein